MVLGLVQEEWCDQMKKKMPFCFFLCRLFYNTTNKNVSDRIYLAVLLYAKLGKWCCLIDIENKHIAEVNSFEKTRYPEFQEGK